MSENHKGQQSDTSDLEETIEKLARHQKEILKAFRRQKGKKAKARAKAVGNRRDLNNELLKINNELKKHEALLSRTRIAKGEKPKNTLSQLKKKQKEEELELRLRKSKESARKLSAKKTEKSVAKSKKKRRQWVHIWSGGAPQ